MRRSPKDIEVSASKISRRGLILGGSMALFMGGLALRMRQLQVAEADQFRLLAEENRINMRLLPPSRGLIFDRDGIQLAENVQNYRVVIVREDAGDVKAALENLRRLLPMSDERFEKALRDVMRHSPFVPVTIADQLTWEQVSEISVNGPALPGITAEVGLTRRYPLEADFAHVLGYVGPVSDYDLSRIDDPDPLLQIPKFQIGKTGVESKRERALRGAAGFKRIEVNAQGRVMRELDRTEGRPGADLQLTVSAQLQNYAQVRLGEESAAAVVIDVTSGDVMATASTPSFDPNKFVRGISVPDYRALTENDHRPLADKSVQGTYPPGSTFKMVTALAALEAGVIAPDETVTCRGFTEVGARRFHCWKRAGHGKVDLLKSLEQSCDVYYYELAQRVGIEKISAMARMLGLGARPQVPMSGVASGLAPTKAWKRERRGAEWVVGDTLNASIGQGFVLASPMQLAIMAARLATGRAVEPRLVRSVDGIDEAAGPAPELAISAANLRAVQSGMFKVSNSRRGTAYRTRVAEKELRMAGKTGTSQVRNITAAERAKGVIRNEDLPWNRRDHALFVCYAPFDNPRYAVSVVVEHGGGGSKAAAPIARDIMLQALYGETPPLSAYPDGQRRLIREQQQTLKLRDIDLPGPSGKTRA